MAMSTEYSAAMTGDVVLVEILFNHRAAHVLYRAVSRKTGKMRSFAMSFRSWPISDSRVSGLVSRADIA